MFPKDTKIEGYDEALWAAMQHEVSRQEEHIELIASENYASQRVMQAQGSVLTTNMQKVIPRAVITAVVRMSTWPSNWLSIA